MGTDIVVERRCLPATVKGYGMMVARRWHDKWFVGVGRVVFGKNRAHISDCGLRRVAGLDEIFDSINQGEQFTGADYDSVRQEECARIVIESFINRTQDCEQ